MNTRETLECFASVYNKMLNISSEILEHLKRRGHWEHTQILYGVEYNPYSEYFAYSTISGAVALLMEEYPFLKREEDTDEYGKRKAIRLVAPFAVACIGGPCGDIVKEVSSLTIEQGMVKVHAYCILKYQIIRDLFVDPEDETWTAEFVGAEPMFKD